MSLRLRAPRPTASSVAARLLAARLLVACALAAAACSAGPRPSPAPVPTAAPAPVPVAAAIDSAAGAIAIPGVPVGLGAPLAAAPHFEHTPGLTWDLDVLPFEGHERVQKYVTLFSTGARDRFTEWLHRGTRYDALIRGKLRAGGLPEDLTYLALVESGYDVHAVSHSRAVGMWQFMAETGREVGLRVDWWVDERRDPVRATDAAVRTLRWLKGQFGSLFVAAAAYNGGPGRVSRGLAQLASVDSAGALPAGDARFFALVEHDVLRDETKNYVPQLIAAALVAKEAARYNIRPRAEAPLAYDEVRVPGLTPLAAVAAASHASRAELLDLNPHLLRGMTPPGAALAVRVPSGQGSAAADRFATLGGEIRRAFRVSVTRRRETWGALAERVGAPRAWLETYNGRLATVARGKNKGRLVAGQAVRVPTEAVLAYARDVVTDGDGPGTLPAVVAPPDAPRDEPSPKASHASTSSKRPVSSKRPDSAKSSKAPATRPAPRRARR